jgi:hypothetical protein
MRPAARWKAACRASGFTIAEVIVSALLFAILVTGALGFIRLQTMGFGKTMDRMSLRHTLRSAIKTLEADIYQAGTNLSPVELGVVRTGETTFSFNAPLSRLSPSGSTDPTASEDSGLTTTVTFFFSPDSTTERPDDFALYRQLDFQEPVVLARNLLRSPDHPFFRYLAVTDTGLDSVPAARVPLILGAHREKTVGKTPADFLPGSIRGVRVVFGVTNGRVGEAEKTSFIARVLRTPNLRPSILEECGEKPVFTSELKGSVVTTETGKAVAELSWERAPDDGGGEGDILRYVLWRRLAGSEGWGLPYLSIPAGKQSYTYRDADLEPGRFYEYGISAQDCRPAVSPEVGSGTVLIPGSFDPPVKRIGEVP